MRTPAGGVFRRKIETLQDEERWATTQKITKLFFDRIVAVFRPGMQIRIPCSPGAKLNAKKTCFTFFPGNRLVGVERSIDFHERFNSQRAPTQVAFLPRGQDGCYRAG